MNDIVIDGKSYDYVAQYDKDNKKYVVFSDEDSVYVNECIINDEEITFFNIDIELQKEILRSLGIAYE